MEVSFLNQKKIELNQLKNQHSLLGKKKEKISHKGILPIQDISSINNEIQILEKKIYDLEKDIYPDNII